MGPIYEENGTLDNPDLLKQLNNAFIELETAMRASKKVSVRRGRASHLSGFGVDKTQRGIAADAVISIASAIKSLKGW